MRWITNGIVLCLFSAVSFADASESAVYVDAFYGGEETGPAINDLPAKMLTLNISKEIVLVARRLGVNTNLLREEDRFVPDGQKISHLHSANAFAYLGIKIDHAERDCVHIIRPSETSSFRARDRSKNSSDDPFTLIAATVKKRSASFARVLQEKLSITSMCISMESSSDHLLEVSSHARPSIIIDFQTTGSGGSYLLDKKKMDEISASVSAAVDSYIKTQESSAGER